MQRKFRRFISKLLILSILIQTSGAWAMPPRPTPPRLPFERPDLARTPFDRFTTTLGDVTGALSSLLAVPVVSMASVRESDDAPPPNPPRLPAPPPPRPSTSPPPPTPPSPSVDRPPPLKVGSSDVPLVSGFNLVSLPHEPDDTDPAAVMTPIAPRLGSVFVYDACDPVDPWKRYDPADPEGSDLDAIDHRQGLWVDATAPVVLPAAGDPPPITRIELCAGWNLIGYPLAQPRPVPSALASIEDKYLRVFGFERADAADPWEVFDVAVPAWANDLETMRPGRGYWLLVTEDVTLDFANQGAPPAVILETPLDLTEVTQPSEVVGTIQSALLERWTLAYRPSGEDGEFVELATGLTPFVSTSVATFDPTLLLNGMYDLRLEAVDYAGQIVDTTITVAVEGQMKIGLFTLSFSDLVVPFAGLDVEVIRTYDSRDKETGDFSVGWRLAIRQGSYRSNRAPGEGWRIEPSDPPNPFPCVKQIETLSHLTTVRLSDVEIYRFRPALDNVIPALGRCEGDFNFQFVDGPLPGTTLEVVGNNRFFFNTSGPGERLIDFDTLEIFEPKDVKLTTRDGRIFFVNLESGVTRLEDLNGNALDLTPEGITHSSGQGIQFERDAEGRIVRITDPLGKTIHYVQDENGDLASVTDRGGNVTSFLYDDRHNVLDIIDPRGLRPIRNDYDEDGRLIRTTDAFGKTITFEHDLGENREIVTNRLGQVRVLEYDGRGNVVREVDELGAVTLRTFDGRDNLLTETDPLGRTTTSVYTSRNDLERVTDPLGNVTSFTYDDRGNPLTVTDARGNVSSTVFDANGNLLEQRDGLGNLATFIYDASGNVLSETDALGNVTSFAYDIKGNRVRETDALANVTTFTHDDTGNVLSQTRTRTLPSGATETLVTSFAYDDLGRLTQTTFPDGTTARLAYDALGKVIRQTDALGRETSMTYNEPGLPVATVFPDGTLESRSYDDEGRVVAQTDRAGRVTTFEYDAAGRLTRTVLPDSSSTENVYDTAGQLVATLDERGSTTSFTYDAGGRRTTTIDALGNATTFAYDAAGNVISITDARGNTTAFTYDALNRQTVTTFPDGTKRTTAYDALGRRVAEIDQAGLATSFAYDAAGRLVGVTDALDRVTAYAYDEIGDLIAQTDANGNTTRFEYDRLGRQIARVFPDGSRETMTYTADGTLASHTDFLGRSTTFEVDSNGRLTRKAFPNDTDVRYTYTQAGRRASVADARGTTSYAYDVRDRVTRLTYPDGRRLDYAYDAAGNRTSLSATVGENTFTTGYTYDALNRLATVTDSDGEVYPHTYDPNGNRASLSFPNGITTTTTFDALNRLTELESVLGVGQVVQSYAFTLGPAGNRTRIDEHDGTSRAYAYDALYRLVGEEVTDAADARIYRKSFTYDPVGNRLEQVHEEPETAPVTTPYAYDNRDRLLTADAIGYGWDTNGNLIAQTRGGDGTDYGWDFENRLVAVTAPDGTEVLVTYDADGNRVRTEVTPANGSPAVTEHLVDPIGPLSHVVLETDANGNLLTHYVRGDELLALIRPDPADKRYVHADGLGSIRFLTDADALVTDRYDYTAFGETLSHAGNDPNPYQFAGEPFDPNVGFYYNRARWLDVATGRFISEDPLRGNALRPLSLHRYLYVAANPVNLIDPSGLIAGGLSEISIRQVIQVVLVSLNVVALISNLNQATLAGLKVRRALQQGRPWDAVAFAAISVLHIGLAALSLVGLSAGISPPPPGLAAVGASLSATGPAQARLFYQVAVANPRLANWVITQVMPVVLSLYVLYAKSVTKETGTFAGRDNGRSTAPRIGDGNAKEGWIHIRNRHILGTDTKGAPGDLFPRNTTRSQLERLARWLVEKGTRISDPSRPIQVYERRTVFNGQRARFRVVVDSTDGNRVITMFPVLGGGS